MSDEEAMDHLKTALEHIERAKEEAERDVSTVELENLRAMAEDCRTGLEIELGDPPYTISID